ncbi:hypothetical protein SynRS9915_00217 [Synechococcus sp. RS9915]|nr:hypothetical protein SynRS9915_00217 [Synechococcus sp. RS9915]
MKRLLGIILCAVLALNPAAVLAMTEDTMANIQAAISSIEKVENNEEANLKSVTLACLSAANALRKIKNEEVNFLAVQVNAFVPAIPALAEIDQLKEQEQSIKDGMERIDCP